MLSQEILHCFAKGHFVFLTCKNVSFVGHFNVINGFAIALKSGNHLIRLRYGNVLVLLTVDDEDRLRDFVGMKRRRDRLKASFVFSRIANLRAKLRI